MEAGGYTGGNGEFNTVSNHNGMSGNDMFDADTGIAGAAGGGYFEKARDTWTKEKHFGGGDYWNSFPDDKYRDIGGPLGGGGGYTKYKPWNYEFGGNGGVAGNGGIITVSTNAIVEAYNGNKYTDDSGKVEYCPIYVQEGRLLKITTSLGYWSDSDNEYYSNLFGREINYTSTWDSVTGNDHVAELREESIDLSLKTKYINPVTKSCQGVGSGAGYIEFMNGSYEVNSNLN